MPSLSEVCSVRIGEIAEPTGDVSLFQASELGQSHPGFPEKTACLPILNPYISRTRTLSGCDGGKQQVSIRNVKDYQRRAPLRLV